MIGTSAVGLNDLRATPFANIYPGVEIHATIIDNILAESGLTRKIFFWSRGAIPIPLSDLARVDSWQEGFLTVLPAVTAYAKIRFRHLPPDQREDAIAEILAEVRDRYGSSPPEVEALGELMALKGLAAALGATVLAEHDEHESFSGDGLIAVRAITLAALSNTAVKAGLVVALGGAGLAGLTSLTGLTGLTGNSISS